MTQTWNPIHQHLPGGTTYDEDRASFTWERARAELAGLPGGRGLNIAHEAVDRHVDEGRGDVTAIRCIAVDGSVTDISYAQLGDLSGRFAQVLTDLGVQRGERVASLLGRQPEQYVAALGTLKRGAVFCPLFSSFGPEPVRERLRLGSVKVLVTTADLYRKRVAHLRDELPDLRHVLVTGGVEDDRTLDLHELMASAAPGYTIPDTEPEDPALLHFTSGTTGKPKGAVHVHGAVVAHHATAAYALDLRRGDVFWCTADPGWVTGTSYGIIAPLTFGATLISYAGEFDAKDWYRTLAEQRVQVWYTAPTALRMLMRYGADLAHDYDLSALRHVASVGEALNPEVVVWGVEALGLPVHDNWWQTETGAIMVSNHRGMEIRPGSMGRPVPGVDAAVLVQGADGRAEVADGAVRFAEPGETGELALRPGWPSMFRGYLDDPERTAKCFGGGWYLSGDLARQDADGYFWFVGRADDVIKSAGHLIGPFEVETAFMEHPAVVEAGVIGKPDPVAGEVVKAFVTLRAGFEPTEELRRDLIAFGRRRLGGLAPKEITFDQHLPHTTSGKVMRRLLKARELGLPEGDVSTLEQAR
ncbi:acetate--CoA ligase [Nocardioides islandensis]|uniref:Acetate--CoA ligase n=1 Tax=Nocardioides islandensis TaxID=433663 RepID=A0A930VBU1_9ACTN|nr:acetate--CoA ligase [Nocardioides islandensis]MBF4764644.1 acetate--CoA ligase [Nocardioides islandensis]